MTILINVQHEPSRCMCHKVIMEFMLASIGLHSAGPCLDGFSDFLEQCFYFAAMNVSGFIFSWGY